MDLIAQIEKRKFLIVGGILLITFSALIVTSLRSPVAFDSFWHLQMGRDWLENGLSPWIDHYSFTYNGHNIRNPPVVFQGLLHLAVSQFGLRTGFQIVRFGFFLLTLGATLLILRQMKAPAIIYATVIPVIVFLLQLRTLVRPELFSYTLSIVALMLYFRADNRISTRNLAPMVVLMGVWSFYHSSVVGYVIFFGFFLDCAVAQFESRASAAVWAKWFVWGLLIVAVGFLNPGFTHSLVQAVTFPSEWKIYINEYLPPAPFLKSIAGIYVITLIALLTPVMAYQQRRFGLLVIWAVLTFSAVTMNRMVTPSAIVVVMLTAYLFINSKTSYRLSLVGGSFKSRIVGFGLLIAIGVTLFSNVERARHFMKENRALIDRYPVAMVEYMRNRHMSGRIFNIYRMGGYLIYQLTPQFQVYIDGRTGILYPLEHMMRYEEVMRTKSPEVLSAELDKYSINQIIWEYSQAKHDLIQEMGGFGLDYMDAKYVLYTRGASNFPLLGKLLSHPECWHPDMLDELNAERQKMDGILSYRSGLFPFANLVIGYSNADDGKAFLDTSVEEMEWLNEMRRFAGFRFLETEHYDLVPPVLGGVEIRKPKDYLASALAMIKVGSYEVATQIITEFSNVQWPRLQPEDVLIHYKLYRLLEKQRSLTTVEQERVEVLIVQLAELGFSGLDLEEVLEVESFCTLSES